MFLKFQTLTCRTRFEEKKDKLRNEVGVVGCYDLIHNRDIYFSYNAITVHSSLHKARGLGTLLQGAYSLDIKGSRGKGKWEEYAIVSVTPAKDWLQKRG